MTTLLANATGRRKTAVAQIRLVAGTGVVQINGLPAEEYLVASPALLLAVQAPLRAVDTTSFDVEVSVSGGGLTGQAEAIQLGLARALTVANPLHRTVLRSHALLTRDAREKERRKYGLKKARKARQFSKR
jgi:small subunit ribosomal protein S9